MPLVRLALEPLGHMPPPSAGRGFSATRRKNKLARKPKPGEVLDHWSKLIDGLSFSSQEFYARVEKALAERQIPNLGISRMDWKEGGAVVAPRPSGPTSSYRSGSTKSN